MNKANVIEIKSLSVQIAKKNGSIPILEHIDLSVESGKVLGLVGESGCGKSMTAFAIMGLLPPGGRITGGSIMFQGEDIGSYSQEKMQKIRGSRIGMIFQEPMTSLNPLITVGKQMGEIFYYHERLRGRANRDRCLELLASVNISEPANVYDCCPFKLSGGMRQRVMIAMALACEPELVIADEPTTALDVTTQAQILDLFNSLRHKTSASFLFVTHDLGVMAEIADRTAVIYSGYVVEECETGELFHSPRHPYTSGLMRSRISRNKMNAEKQLYTIPGAVPVPGNRPGGCPFTARCERRGDRCEKEAPPLTGISGGHRVRCWEAL
jgi:oligopeptide/dipeptide ABC transporter ATP-binding protein